MVDKVAYFNGVGRRKSSVARVHLAPRVGKKNTTVEVNGKPINQYFSDENRVADAMQPFVVLGINADDYAIKITVRGGGCTGQADAISLGLARSLNALEMHQLGLSKDQAHAMQEEAARIALEAAQVASQEPTSEDVVTDEEAPVSTSKRAWYMKLKKHKLLRVDSRKVERKKVGRRGARAKPQFSKR